MTIISDEGTSSYQHSSERWQDIRTPPLNTPSAGMFVWIEVHYEKHPRFVLRDQNPAGEKPTVEAMNIELLQKIFDAGVVLMPAQTFAIADDGINGNQAPIQDVSG